MIKGRICFRLRCSCYQDCADQSHFRSLYSELGNSSSPILWNPAIKLNALWQKLFSVWCMKNTLVLRYLRNTVYVTIDSDVYPVRKWVENCTWCLGWLDLNWPSRTFKISKSMSTKASTNAVVFRSVLTASFSRPNLIYFLAKNSYICYHDSCFISEIGAWNFIGYLS